jgi:hypothetical protein
MFTGTSPDELDNAADNMYAMLIEFVDVHDSNNHNRDKEFKISPRAKELITETFALNRRNQNMQKLAQPGRTVSGLTAGIGISAFVTPVGTLITPPYPKLALTLSNYNNSYSSDTRASHDRTARYEKTGENNELMSSTTIGQKEIDLRGGLLDTHGARSGRRIK